MADAEEARRKAQPEERRRDVRTAAVSEDMVAAGRAGEEMVCVCVCVWLVASDSLHASQSPHTRVPTRRWQNFPCG